MPTLLLEENLQAMPEVSDVVIAQVLKGMMKSINQSAGTWSSRWATTVANLSKKPTSPTR